MAAPTPAALTGAAGGPARAAPTCDRDRFAAALAGLERRFEFAPRGVLTIIGYGRRYFDRLPTALVRSSLPRLRGDRARSACEEAVPGPTDPDDVTTIERNDLLLVLRRPGRAARHR